MVNWHTWNYKKAEKTAPLIYHLTLTYTVENEKYTKTIHTCALSNNLKIRANSTGELPIKYLKKSPHAVVCTSEVLVKEMNKVKIYAVTLAPILATILGAVMIVGFVLLCT